MENFGSVNVISNLSGTKNPVITLVVFSIIYLKCNLPYQINICNGHLDGFPTRKSFAI